MIENRGFLKNHPSDIYMGHFFKKSFSRTLALYNFIKKVKNDPFLSFFRIPSILLKKGTPQFYDKMDTLFLSS